MQSSTFEEEVQTILEDPAASFWLKKAVKSAIERDCFDAVTDSEALLRLMEKRALEVTARSPQALGLRFGYAVKAGL